MSSRFISFIIFLSLLANVFIAPFSVFAQVQDNTDGTKHILITELMVDPEDVSDSKGEWIEVFNNSSFEVNLNKWVINDGPSHEISGNYNIPPKAHAVLCRREDSEENGGVK